MQMTTAQLMSFLKQHFPQVAQSFIVRISDEGRLSVEMPVNDKHLRPGGTVSGPSMFALADVAFYLAILQKIGPEGLTVTCLLYTSPSPRDQRGSRMPSSA